MTFQPTRSQERDPSTTAAALHHRPVSTHALARARRFPTQRPTAWIARFNPRARKSATQYPQSYRRSPASFNPRARKSATNCRIACLSDMQKFQPTRSQERDGNKWTVKVWHRLVSTHALARARRIIARDYCTRIVVVSTHALARARLLCLTAFCGISGFQPTRSQERDCRRGTG